MDLKFNWAYDSRTETYVFGDASDGGGVYEEDEPQAGNWYGNSCPKQQDLCMVGPFKTKLEAQLAVEEDYIKRTEDV